MEEKAVRTSNFNKRQAKNGHGQMPKKLRQKHQEDTTQLGLSTSIHRTNDKDTQMNKSSDKNDGNLYLKEVKRLKKSIANIDGMFTGEMDDESRTASWIRLEVLGQPMAEKYAWAIPDARALKILSNFAPLIEVACGKGYWASLLRSKGVDILAIDKYVNPEEAWTEIIRAGPEILSKKKDMRRRNLFLSYPDESECVGIECLKHFRGEYIIHVGEMITTGLVQVRYFRFVLNC